MVDFTHCRCNEAVEELSHVLIECGINEKWTKKMFFELKVKIEYLTNADFNPFDEDKRIRRNCQSATSLTNMT